MINTIFEGPKPFHSRDEAAKWEKHRSKGLFFWRVFIGLFVALLACVWGSLWFFLREVVFSDILQNDWVSNFIIQNLTFFLCGFCLGYYVSRAMWEDREKHYQDYLKNNKSKVSE